MYPSYSPLFTLGLFPSPKSSPVEQSPQNASSGDCASAIYFTLQAGKRDTVELRSFLSLSLADRKRRTPSHRCRVSALTKSTSWTCTTDARSLYNLARVQKPTIMMSPAPVAPARRRTSKESLRNIPSPKPAPSATLPDLPLSSDACSLPSSPLKKRPASAVATSLLSPAPRVQRPASLCSGSISSHDRRQSRMDALACLEGRVPNRATRPRSLRNNFMSLSDDEDGKSTRPKLGSPSSAPVIQVDDLSAFADVEDEVDAIIPAVSRKRQSVDQARPARPTKLGRKRRSTLESWFPLKSFIDLKDDDMSSWNWRSFIEIGGVS